MAVPVPHPIPRFQVWGSNPSQDIFLWCDSEWQLINQSTKFFKKYFPLIGRCKKFGKGRNTEKLPWLGFEPQTWKRGIRKLNSNFHSMLNCSTRRCRGKEGKRPLIAYCFTQCANGCSLGSLFFPGQDNLVQKCMCLTMRRYAEKYQLLKSLGYFSLSKITSALTCLLALLFVWLSRLVVGCPIIFLRRADNSSC